MEKREDALREALSKNSNEAERWETYKKDQEAAIENLQEFSKHLTVDVMVPIGRKAFMPGQLIHTNEVLVGHYQGYFSKCTAHKAKEICELRIKKAKNQLQMLETEADLWTNKLNKPYLEGVLPTAREREIIEDYDEEAEKQWRLEHRFNVKKAKLAEKKERESQQKIQKMDNNCLDSTKSDEEILKMLEDAELMEELEKELDSLELDEVDSDTLKKLMQEDIPLSKSKMRVAQEPKSKVDENESRKIEGIVKKSSTEKTPASNNNTNRNPDIIIPNNDDNDSDSDFELTEEVNVIKNQAKFLPLSDQIGFYEYQVEIVKQKLTELRVTDEKDIDEKLHLLNVLEELEDLLAIVEEELIEDTNDEAEAEVVPEEKTKTKESLPTDLPQTQKRRISFALENDTLVFRHNEAVSQMLPKISPVVENRDIIKLSDKGNNIPVMINSTEKQIDKKKIILEKVEKNLEYVANNQSKADCDLITKIIDEAESNSKTVFITFQHSTQLPTDFSKNTEIEDCAENSVPGKPSDIYDLYLKQLHTEQNKIEPKNIYTNSYIGEDEVKAPILTEAKRIEAYEDPRTKFMSPQTENKENCLQAKSILRNKEAVERETHLTATATSTATNKKPKKPKGKAKQTYDEENIMSAYNKVMNDVVEKPLSAPEPLPEVNFIDAHAPKKRVSRFKLTRTVTEQQNT